MRLIVDRRDEKEVVEVEVESEGEGGVSSVASVESGRTAVTEVTCNVRVRGWLWDDAVQLDREEKEDKWEKGERVEAEALHVSKDRCGDKVVVEESSEEEKEEEVSFEKESDFEVGQTTLEP